MLLYVVFVIALTAVSIVAYVPAQVKLFSYSVDFFLKKPDGMAAPQITSKPMSSMSSQKAAGRSAMMGSARTGTGGKKANKGNAKLEKGRGDRPDPTPELYVEEPKGFWSFLQGKK